MEISHQIVYAVAEYLEGELFHEVGKKLGVHKNRRIQIEKSKEDIVERTFDLLDQWHKKEGEQATLGKLVNVLKEFDPEDMVYILEELCEEVKTCGNIKQNQLKRWSVQSTLFQFSCLLTVVIRDNEYNV